MSGTGLACFSTSQASENVHRVNSDVRPCSLWWIVVRSGREIGCTPAVTGVAAISVADATQPLRVPVQQDLEATRALRAGLGAFATGVTIITAFEAEKPVGITVNSFASVSLDPPLILWSVARDASCAPAFAPGRHFCVHVLAASQEALARRFARTGGDKFAELDWMPSQYGAPLLPGCIAEYHCSVSACHGGGDHMIIVGHIEAWRTRNGQALLFHRGEFVALPGISEA